MRENSDMDADMSPTGEDPDKTLPPLTALRCAMPVELYATMPVLGKLTRHRPQADEDNFDYLSRLRGSDTPEEAVTFTAFAALPKMAIWWGYECLRVSEPGLSREDRAMLQQIARWTAEPVSELRFDVMRAALWAEHRTPTVLLGLALGWSGGPAAPNDPTPVPLQRCPRAINAAVLSSLANNELARRPVLLGRFGELAVSMFRIY